MEEERKKILDFLNTHAQSFQLTKEEHEMYSFFKRASDILGRLDQDFTLILKLSNSEYQRLLTAANPERASTAINNWLRQLQIAKYIVEGSTNGYSVDLMDDQKRKILDITDTIVHAFLNLDNQRTSKQKRLSELQYLINVIESCNGEGIVKNVDKLESILNASFLPTTEKLSFLWYITRYNRDMYVKQFPIEPKKDFTIEDLVSLFKKYQVPYQQFTEQQLDSLLKEKSKEQIKILFDTLKQLELFDLMKHHSYLYDILYYGDPKHFHDFHRFSIDHNFRLEDLVLLPQAFLLDSFMKNFELLESLHFNLSDVLKRSPMILIMEHEHLQNNLEVLKRYGFDIEQLFVKNVKKPVYTFLSLSFLQDFIDQFIEIGCNQYIHNYVFRLQPASFLIIQRFLVAPMFKLARYRGGKMGKEAQLSDWVRTGIVDSSSNESEEPKLKIPSSEELNQYVPNAQKAYLSKSPYEILLNKHPFFTIDARIFDDSLIQQLDKKYQTSDLEYRFIHGEEVIIISRNKVLSNASILFLNDGKSLNKEKLLTTVLHNTHLKEESFQYIVNAVRALKD